MTNPQQQVTPNLVEIRSSLGDVLVPVRELIQSLQQAEAVCNCCGETYGAFVGDRLCTSWSGKCDVCGEPGAVTSPRNYGYFHNGLAKLRAKLGID